MFRHLDPATVATVALIPRYAALAAFARLLDLYADLAAAATDDDFDQLDAEIAVERCELFPLLDAARTAGDVAGPIRDAAAELRRHLPADFLGDDPAAPPAPRVGS